MKTAKTAKTMKTSKKNLRTRVLDFLSRNPEGVKARAAHAGAAPDAPVNSVHNMLWMMRKGGQIGHDAEAHLYYPLPEPLPEPTEQGVGVQIPEHAQGVDESAKPYDPRRDILYCGLRDRYDNLREEHNDALAVIRWLETKVDALIRAQVV
jgi:hypothetical protein